MFKRITWIFLFVFVFLLGLALYLQFKEARKQVQSTFNQDLEQKSLTNASEINYFKFISDDGTYFEAERNEKNEWVLLNPPIENVDNIKINELVQAFLETKILLDLESPMDIEATGIKYPSNVIKMGKVGGTYLELRIGKLTPIQNGYYANYKDEPLIIVISNNSVQSFKNWLTKPQLLPTEIPPTQTNIP